MSYARTGEGSDVYVYSDGEQIHCEAHGKRFSVSADDGHNDMIEHLYMHRRMGHEVPARAFDRLYAERDGIPYETDVERSLRAMKEEGWHG